MCNYTILNYVRPRGVQLYAVPRSVHTEINALILHAVCKYPTPSKQAECLDYMPNFSNIETVIFATG
jgi:hypothetical protein